MDSLEWYHVLHLLVQSLHPARVMTVVVATVVVGPAPPQILGQALLVKATMPTAALVVRIRVKLRNYFRSRRCWLLEDC